MKEEMMHIVKKDRKKLLLLSALAVVAVFLLILGGGVSTSTNESEVSDASVATYPIKDDVAELERILGTMTGVGKVKVSIAYEGDVTEYYAYNEERSEVIKEDGTTDISQKKELVLVDGDGAPVVTKREYPAITGVLVTAEGAWDDRVRENVIHAVASYLGIGKNRIEVTAMEVE